MMFSREKDFEEALISLLKTKGWEDKVLKNCTEKDLIQNWADILFANNRSIDRLNDYPLTDGEMQQIIEQINTLRTPLQLNGFINGGTVSVTRDNPDDKAHFGKEVSLKIYERREIAGGESRYQIAQQPQFPTKSKVAFDRRGDLMLLINGMPVIHIELKRSGVSVLQAVNQIEKYSAEGVFTGLFSLVQVFVAMNPEEMLYFANPGPEGSFNPDYYFHWADFNNELVNDWKDIGSHFLSIPMAHQLIGFYTVADESDGILKVMRSYQYYAVNKIADRVSKNRWDEKSQLGGHIWHTTGSGKTLTSFKAAQLISTSKDADKVVFLMDRIELGVQSIKEYRNFAGVGLTEEQKANTVQDTEDTNVLVGKLKSNDVADTLIVTSIQKMSNIKMDSKIVRTSDIDRINQKKLVFIVDECHRSTFGDMLIAIKDTFPKALFFGFSGTPIHDENKKKETTTAMLFGDELHRYSIADGIRDKNVLGFDPYKVLTYKDKDLRQVVALERAKAKDLEEIFTDPDKIKVFNYYMNTAPMAGYRDSAGNYIKGIEDEIPSAQYKSDRHRKAVVDDIKENWMIYSVGGKFHSILATSSIPEAIQYYRLFKDMAPELKVTGLFDPSDDNTDGVRFKLEGLYELIQDYNEKYHMEYSAGSYGKMKKDIAARLAHKKPYHRIDKDRDKQIDLLIVVDQMLTGFDSKWINTLYLDKMLKYEGLIQAFSRTNRLFGNEKPFGTIRYYRKPYTMEKRIEDAFALYSGDKPLGLFVDKLPSNIKNMNSVYQQIKDLFESAGESNFERLPNNPSEKGKFAKLFREFNRYLDAAKVQGFKWTKLEYDYVNDITGEKSIIQTALDGTVYLILVKRYKELFNNTSKSEEEDEIPYDIDTYITQINTDKIDSDYMNSRFEKYLKILSAHENEEELQRAEDELHKTFAVLSQEEQKYANIFLHDIQSGDVRVEKGKKFRDYVTEYMQRARDDSIHQFANLLGLNENILRKIMSDRVTESNINEYGRLDALKETVDKVNAKVYIEQLEKRSIPAPMLGVKIDKLLRDFILNNGNTDLDDPEPELDMVAEKSTYGSKA